MVIVIKQDVEFVTKKLGLSEQDFAEIMQAKPVPHENFEVERSVYEMYPYLRPLRGVVNRVKKCFN